MPIRPLRPLAVVALLALGDYLLWNWSLSANHDILALVSGMILIPLLIALAWLLFLSLARLVAHTAQRPRAGALARAGGGESARGSTTSRTASGKDLDAMRSGSAATGGDMIPALPVGHPTSPPPPPPAAPPSSKIAA